VGRHEAVGGAWLRKLSPERRTPAPAAPPHRRLFHLAAASIFPALLIFFPKEPLLAASGALLVVSLVGEYLRLRRPDLNRPFLTGLRLLLKGREDRSITGSTYVLASTVLVIGVMPQPIAVLALFYLAIPDPMAALVGERFGRHGLAGKSLEGTATFLVAALIAGAVLVATALGTTFAVMAAGAVTAAFLELMPARLDDNVRVPLGSGAVMWLASQVWA